MPITTTCPNCKALFRLADTALYSAKHDGRNHVHLA